MANDTADFWFDPGCPWAWMASRWVHEVVQVRSVDVHWRVMSLAVLNEGRDDLDPEYKAHVEQLWGPVRVLTKARLDHGDEVLGGLFTSLGERIHPGGRRDLRQVMAEALAEHDLPATLIEVYDSDDVDDQLRESNRLATDLVGDDVGTPVIQVAGTAFFGPVITPAPRGEAAGKLWDGVLAVAATDGFYELKRTRDRDPDFS